VSINPLAEAALVRFQHPQNPWEALGSGTPMAKLHLPVRVGGDAALFQGLGKALLELEHERPGHGVARAFVEGHTSGFEAYAAARRTQSWPEIEEASGIGREALRNLAGELARTNRIIACWAMGLTQHEHAVANIQEVVNVLLLRGAMGRPGAGACPVRGHSNVQGDRTMGIDHRPPAKFLDRLGECFRFAPPREHGLDVVAALEAMERGEVDVLVSLGGNLLSAGPDTRAAAAALRRCRLTAHVATKLNRSHLVTGETALILPCLGRSERDVQAGGPQFITVEDSMGLVHRSQGVLAPIADTLKSEPAIVAGLAAATLGETTPLPWRSLLANYDLIRDAIAHVVPGFTSFNARVRREGGFALPNGARERRFDTATGKAQFTVHELPRPRVENGQFLLTTVRSHDQYNTTIYGLDDRYRGIKGGRRVVFIHPDDLAALGAAAGDPLDLTSHFRGEMRTAARFRAVPYDIPRGCLAAYFPEANVLVPLGQKARGSNTPASKSIVVTLRRSAPGPGPREAETG
jgi:molybdopterin-dependent oxidoreductase alpha subunit